MAEKDKPGEKAGVKRSRPVEGGRPKAPKAPKVKVKQGSNGAPVERARKGAAPTPEAPAAAVKAKGWLDSFKRYLKSVRAEFARITWPTRQELRAATIVVIATLVVVTLYLYAVDQIMARIFGQVAR